MTALLIIVSVGIILYGYLLMCRLDCFIERGGFTKESDASKEKEILLYAEKEIIDEIKLVLDNADVTYDCTTEPEIKDSTIYHWIGAISNDDANNLLICLSAKRRNSSVCTIAKCNNIIYESIFRQMGITIILKNSVSANQIRTCLRG